MTAIVVHELGDPKVSCPVILLIVNIASQVLLKGLILLFCLPVSLQVECSTELSLHPQEEAHC